VQAGTNGGAADILFTPSATSNGAQLFCSRQGLLATMRQDYSAVSLAQEQKLMTFREYRLKKLEHGLSGREPRYLIVKFVRVQGQALKGSLGQCRIHSHFARTDPRLKYKRGNWA
jgi:hypothetical protein